MFKKVGHAVRNKENMNPTPFDQPNFESKIILSGSDPERLCIRKINSNAKKIVFKPCEIKYSRNICNLD